MSMSMLFVGISFTDPNIRHVLALIRESFKEAPPDHFAIVRAPQRPDYSSDDEFKVRRKQHELWAKDLKRYGLDVVEINEYAEIPDLLRKIERRVAIRRVWVSGSWPIERGGAAASNIHAFAEAVGKKIGDTKRDLVTGAGLLVGSASISGFLASLRDGGRWDLERRLIARPFPQPLNGTAPNLDNWKALRNELARQAGFVIFVGGAKIDSSGLIPAGGVISEFEIAQANGSYLIPVGATGGAAEVIYQKLLGSSIEATGPSAQRPTDDELKALADASLLNDNDSRNKLLDILFEVVDRLSKIS